MPAGESGRIDMQLQADMVGRDVEEKEVVYLLQNAGGLTPRWDLAAGAFEDRFTE